METPPNSQDVHHSTVLNAILAPIRDLNENWKVDLSMHLETYLRELCDQQVYGSVNFVEAALLIQRSTGIYVKKVEYLWNLLMQVLESFRKKGMPGEKGHERRKKSGCISELFQDFVDIPVNPDKKKWKGKVQPVKLEPPYYSELEYNCPREKKLSLFDHMFEPVGDKSDFRLNFAISDTYMLEEELSYLNNPESQYEDSDFGDNDGHSPVDNNDSGNANDQANEVPMNVDNVAAEPMTVSEEPLVPQQESRQSLAGESHTRRGEMIATINTVNSSINVWESEAGSIPDKTVKVQDRCKMPCDTLEKSKRRDVCSVSSLVTDNISVSFGNRYEDFPKFRLEFIKESKNKKKVVKELQKKEEVEEYRKTLASDFPVDFLGFGDNEISSGEEDGGFTGYPDDIDQDDPLSADPNEANADPEGSATPLAEDFPFQNILNVGDTSDWSQVYQNILTEKMHSARVGQQDVQATLATRVNHWHESIHRKLQGAEERGSMDIHEYGTHILNTFPRREGKVLKHTIQFAEVVKDEEEEEVCRYFLASLMLANTYNVEISESDPRKLAMNCMELTLLNSARHHEALEEYEAPSQAQAKTHRKSKK